MKFISGEYKDELIDDVIVKDLRYCVSITGNKYALNNEGKTYLYKLLNADKNKLMNMGQKQTFMHRPKLGRSLKLLRFFLSMAIWC